MADGGKPKVEKRERQEMHECVEFMPCVFSVFGPPSSSFFLSSSASSSLSRYNSK